MDQLSGIYTAVLHEILVSPDPLSCERVYVCICVLFLRERNERRFPRKQRASKHSPESLRTK